MLQKKKKKPNAFEGLTHQDKRQQHTRKNNWRWIGNTLTEPQTAQPGKLCFGTPNENDGMADQRPTREDRVNRKYEKAICLGG